VLFFWEKIKYWKIQLVPWGINPFHPNWKWAFKPCFEYRDYGNRIVIHLCLFQITLTGRPE
jgi:hypothetical protein